MIEHQHDIVTTDGVMPTWVYHPEHDGPSPVVLYLMDAPSIRPALRTMAQRLASAGYYVMLPYLFYRGGPFREFGASDEDMHARQDLMGQIDPTNILGDIDALFALADKDSAAAPGPAGAVGFCMSGGLVISGARAFPERIAAVASIHGAWLVRDQADSPHLDLNKVNAEIYLGWADNDPTAPIEDKETLEAALVQAGVNYTIDFFANAVHGYAPPGSDRYDPEASETHWERVHSLFRRNLWRCPSAA